MTSIITADIINSRTISDQARWLHPLKGVLKEFGKSPAAWEIFRGDSFQLEIYDPGMALLAAIKIKAAIKSIKPLDVRMAIGIGDKTFSSPKITEANGEAFINSGEKFEELQKNKQRLAIGTPWPEIDRQLNLMLTLASIAMDNWSEGSAEIIAVCLKYPALSQKDLGKKLKITQSSVSERQTRANLTQITELEKYYRELITNLIG